MERPDFLSSPLPIMAAPMAGGPGTVALALAVHDAGDFPFLAGGYKSAEALAREIAEVWPLSERFGVNLFVPNSRGIDRAVDDQYLAELHPKATKYGVRLPADPVEDKDFWFGRGWFR